MDDTLYDCSMCQMRLSKRTAIMVTTRRGWCFAFCTNRCLSAYDHADRFQDAIRDIKLPVAESMVAHFLPETANWVEDSTSNMWRYICCLHCGIVYEPIFKWPAYINACSSCGSPPDDCPGAHRVVEWI